jgi:hypothetical protein
MYQGAIILIDLFCRGRISSDEVGINIYGQLAASIQVLQNQDTPPLQLIAPADRQGH